MTLTYPISIWKKLNPLWWPFNEADPIENEPQMWPDKPLWQRRILWWLRNPFENFNRYVIGERDRSPVYVGPQPEDNFYWIYSVGGGRRDPGGWHFHWVRPTVGVIAKHLWLPFISFNGTWQFYAGWKHDGPAGLALRKSEGW